MGQGYDLQKDIERYREELLRLAARGQPQTSAPCPAQLSEPKEKGEAAGEKAEAKTVAGEEKGSWEPQAQEAALEEPFEWQEEPDPSLEQQEKREETKAAEGTSGTLRIQVSAARGLQPVKGALVTVSRVEAGMETLLHILHTGADGFTPDCAIPVPSGEGGQKEGNACAYCHIRVDKPGFFVCHAYRVPVYAAETAIQYARMIPLPAASPAAREGMGES